MKKFFSKLAIVALAVALCVTFAGCNILTIYVPSENKPNQEIGSSSATVTDKTIIPDGTRTNSYGKTYKVASVDLKCAKEKGVEQNSVDATAAVYESNVTVESLVSGSSVYGSGTIIDIEVTYENDGYNDLPFLYILTCHHVIDGASEVLVYIPIENTATDEVGDYDYKSIAFPATLMGSDKDTDIAVLRIEINDHYEAVNTQNYDKKIKKAKIGAYDLSRGEEIFAIGCPTGSLPGTVSYGHVSNLYVPVNVSDIGEMTLHQTDTATNKGNSGGGIYNYAGQLVGMLNSGDTERDGISFFIPVLGRNGIKNIATELIETVTNDDDGYGYIKGRWKLGASFAQDQMGGIYITNIIDGSAIANAEIPDGRYIFSMSYTKDGKENSCKLSTLTDFDTFYQQMKKDLKIDDKISVTYGYYTRGNRQVVEDTVEITITQYIYAPAK